MRRSSFAFGVAVAVLAAGLVHAASLGAPFFADDWLFLDQARFRSLFQVLASPDPLGNYFRPLGRQVWFWFWGALSGESPVVFHAANLMVFAGSIVLLALLTRRVSGAFAGVVAAAFLALHYAADVPVRWASGSQDLLALALGLSALLAHVQGRRVLAGACFFLALLCKESVVLLPLAAIALDREAASLGARVRRATPLALAGVAWLALAAWASLRRGAPGAELAPSADAALAVPVLLARVTLGLEWPTGAWPFTRPIDPGGAVLVALLIALAGVGFAAPRVERAAATARAVRAARAGRSGATGKASAAPPVAAPGADGVRGGLVWSLAAALPVVVVAPLWSAYYFLFSLAGVGLALGSLVAHSRRPGLVAVLVLGLVGWASSQARGLQEFATAPSAWSGQSHVNPFYLDRGMAVVTRAVNDLRLQVPRPEPRTTFFLTGLPSFASVQVADGPLVRGVYRDSSLRSYYLSQLTRERLARGPRKLFFFHLASGRLQDRTRERGVFMSTALGQILNGKLDVAEAALEAAAANGEGDLGLAYVTSLVAYDRGDRERAHALFEEMGYRLGRDGASFTAAARQQLARADTLGAVRTLREGVHEHMLDAGLHALLADVLMSHARTRPEGHVEAYAARLLDPESGRGWRRWAHVLATESRQREAIAALDRYARLDPAGSAADRGAQDLRAILVRMLPGGDIAQRAMKQELAR